MFLDSAGTETDLLAHISQTPWLQDIVADGFDLNDLSNLEFRDPSGGVPGPTINAIYVEAAGMVFNIPTTNNFAFSVNDVNQLTISDTAIDTLNNTLILGTGSLQFQNVNVSIQGTGTVVMQIDVPTSGRFDFKIQNSLQFSFDANKLDIRDNNLNQNSGQFIYWNLDLTRRIKNDEFGFEFEIPSGDNFNFIIATASEMTLDAVALTLAAGNNIVLQSSGATGFMDIGEIATPVNPVADVGRLYVKDLATVTTLFFRDSAGTETNLLAGGGGEFFGPWTADHDAGGFSLINLGDNTATQDVALDITKDEPGVAGQRDSNILQFEGTAFDSAGHTVQWQQSVNITTDAGVSEFIWQSRIDVAAFATRFAVNDAGLITTGSITNKSQLNSAIVYTDQVNTFGAFAQTFADSTLTLLDATGDTITILPGTQPANRSVAFPTLAVSVGDILITNVGQTITSSKIFNDAILFIRNPADTFSYAFRSSAIITANKDIILPLLIANDTFVFESHIQTLAGKTLTTPTIASFVNATHDHQVAAGGGQLDSTLALSDTANIVYLNTANIYIAGNRQDFLGLLAGTAGLNVGGIAGNPTTQVNGDIWYNSTSNTLFGRVNGVDVNLGQSGSEVLVWTADHSANSFDLTTLGNLLMTADETHLIDITRTTAQVDDYIIGEIRFRHPDGEVAPVIQNYGRIIGVMESDAIGAEHGSLQFFVTEAGVHDVAYMSFNDASLANIVILKPTLFADVDVTIKDNRLLLESPDGLTPVTFINSQQTLARNLTIPILTANDTLAVLGLAQTWIATQTLNSFKGTGAVTVTDILDEDDMISDSATKLSTQQSIKAYVDAVPGGNTFARVVKKVDETRNNSGLFANDAELVVPLNANKIYGFLLVLLFKSALTPDFKYRFPLNGNTGRRIFTALAPDVPAAATTLDASITITTTNAEEYIMSSGHVKTTGVPGDLALQWAQATGDAANTTVQAGSYLIVWEETA